MSRASSLSGFRRLALLGLGLLAAGVLQPARAQTAITFDFESGTLSGIPTSTVNYTQDGETLVATTDFDSQLSSEWGTILAGTESLYFSLTDKSLLTTFTLQSGHTFDLDGFLFDNENGDPADIHVTTNKGDYVLEGVPGELMAHTADFTSGVPDRSIFEGITQFSVWADGGLFFNIDNIAMTNIETPVPEPATYAALAGALALGVAGLRRYRSRRSAS